MSFKLYDFECNDCKHTDEYLYNVADPLDIVTCNKCSSLSVTRLMPTPAFSMGMDRSWRTKDGTKVEMIDTKPVPRDEIMKREGKHQR